MKEFPEPCGFEFSGGTRRCGMARRLDKIEKEIGFCEGKLEKERRILKQVQFLKVDLELIDLILASYPSSGEFPQPIAPRQEQGGPTRALREDFLAVGLVEILREEREILDRERQELAGRLKAFAGIEGKRGSLEGEKMNSLKRLSPAHSSRIRRLNDGVKKVERQYNTFKEDLVNLDEGIFFLERNLDYLKSCRTILIAAKGDLDIDFRCRNCPLPILFRHSKVGRAKEMADGADRNLKMAQKELVCLASVRTHPELYQRVLIPLLEALFADIFIDGKLDASLRVIEAALANNLGLTEGVKEKRMLLADKIEEIEKARDKMFSRLGASRQGWPVR
jgi:hypothetical protein